MSQENSEKVVQRVPRPRTKKLDAIFARISISPNFSFDRASELIREAVAKYSKEQENDTNKPGI